MKPRNSRARAREIPDLLHLIWHSVFRDNCHERGQTHMTDIRVDLNLRRQTFDPSDLSCRLYKRLPLISGGSQGPCELPQKYELQRAGRTPRPLFRDEFHLVRSATSCANRKRGPRPAFLLEERSILETVPDHEFQRGPTLSGERIRIFEISEMGVSVKP